MRRLVSATLIIIILCLGLFAGCSPKKSADEENKNSLETQPVSSIAIGEEDAKNISDKYPVRVYFANEDNSKLKAQIRYVDLQEAKKGTEYLAALIIQELIKGPDRESGLRATIPKDVKLVSPVKVKDGIATVNLSKQLIDNHVGGKANEQMTIYSIVNSLTELKDISKVKFLVEGKARQTLKGSFQFDQLFPRSESLISKDGVVPSSSSSITEEGKESGNKNKPAEESSEETYIDIEEDEMIE